MKKTKNNGKYRKIQILTAIFCFSFLIRADAGITRQAVSGRLQQLIDMYNYTIENWEYCGTRQCHAFANMIFDSVFDLNGEVIGSFSEGTDYVFDSVHSEVMCVGTLQPGYRISDLEQLLSKAMPGDFLQVKRRKNKQNGHSMIVVQVDLSENQVKVFDANTDGINTAMCRRLTFGQIYSENQGISLYHYIDYTEDGQSTRPESLGQDFYGYLIQVNTGFCVANGSSGNVDAVLRSEGNDQIWHFERLENGSYRISSQQDGKVLEAKDPENRNVAGVCCSGWQDLESQKWCIEEENGYFTLRTENDDKVLNLTPTTRDHSVGAVVNVRDKDDAVKQNFRIEIVRIQR